MSFLFATFTVTTENDFTNKVASFYQGSVLPVRYEVATQHQGQVPGQGRHGGPRGAREHRGQGRGV